MGFTHRIDHDNRAMFVTAEGPITIKDIRNHLFKERYEHGLTYAELIDARTATPEFLPVDVREVVSILRVFAKENTLGPTAVVVSTDLGFGVIRMLEHLVEDVCAIRPFRDVDAALEWLRETRLNIAQRGWSPAAAVANAKEVITGGTSGTSGTIHINNT